MRTRVAIAVDDGGVSLALVSLLRGAGYLIVEPEVCELMVIEVASPVPGLRICDKPCHASDHHMVSRFLPAPIETNAVLAMLLQLAPRRAVDGHTQPYDR
jgi:hypothetical protein